jgi:hypothetical protein
MSNDEGNPNDETRRAAQVAAVVFSFELRH